MLKTRTHACVVGKMPLHRLFPLSRNGIIAEFFRHPARRPPSHVYTKSRRNTIRKAPTIHPIRGKNAAAAAAASAACICMHPRCCVRCRSCIVPRRKHNASDWQVRIFTRRLLLPPPGAGKIFFPSLSLLRSGSSSHCRPADALSYNRRRVIPLLAICIPRGSCAKRSSLSLSREGEVGEKGSGGAAAGGERERERGVTADFTVTIAFFTDAHCAVRPLPRFQRTLARMCLPRMCACI